MKSQIQKISQISPEQSVICIIGTDVIPESLNLSDKEIEFAQNRFSLSDEKVFINSYNRCIYLVRAKDNVPHYKIREELRRAAYKLRKLIKENNHDSLVITSYKTYKGAIEDFAEGLLLSSYSFDKYKTMRAERGNESISSETASSWRYS